jgi:hypothetical protein
MRTVGLALGLVMLGSPAGAYTYWNQVRHSAQLPGDRVTIRVENPAGPGIENALLYSAGGVQELPMAGVPDGPATVEGAAPAPIAERRFYGFRLWQDEALNLLPVRIADGVEPVPGELTQVASDPAGDELFGLTHLDLVDCRLSFSGSRLFAALRNVGGGFPVNSGFTFYSYLLGIADPAQADPDTIFALMYTFNQPGIIGPGLYKITGTGLDDLEKLGDITVATYPGENTLLLSCQLADLTSDPDFSAWYDAADPRIAVAGFTQKITVFGGAQEADRTPGGTSHLREIWIDPEANRLPGLEDLRIVNPGPNAYAQVVYTDADANCPVLSEIVFDGTESYPMRPLTLDYAASVVYATDPGIPPLVTGLWDEAVARFSDNATDIVEAWITGTWVPDETHPEDARLWRVESAPNPGTGTIEFRVPASLPSPWRLTIVDATGRTIARVTAAEGAGDGRAMLWDGRDRQGREVPTGSYGWRLEAPRARFAGTLVRVR